MIRASSFLWSTFSFAYRTFVLLFPSQVTWLCKDASIYPFDMIEYDHLITVPKLEENVELKDVLTLNTKYGLFSSRTLFFFFFAGSH